MAEPEPDKRDFWLRCECDKRLRAPATLAGRRAQCPRCGAQFVVMPSFEEVNELLERTPSTEPRKIFVGTTRTSLFARISILLLFIGIPHIPALANPPAFNSVQNIPASGVRIIPPYFNMPTVFNYETVNGPSPAELRRNALRKQRAVTINEAKAKAKTSSSQLQLAGGPPAAPAGATEEQLLQHAVHMVVAEKTRYLEPKAKALLYREAKACSLSVQEYVQLFMETEARAQREQ